MTKKLITLSILTQLGFFSTNTFAHTTNCTCGNLESLGYRGYACCSGEWQLTALGPRNWICKNGSLSTDAYVQTDLGNCQLMSPNSPSKNFLKK